MLKEDYLRKIDWLNDQYEQINTILDHQETTIKLMQGLGKKAELRQAFANNYELINKMATNCLLTIQELTPDDLSRNMDIINWLTNSNFEKIYEILEKKSRKL